MKTELSIQTFTAVTCSPFISEENCSTILETYTLVCFSNRAPRTVVTVSYSWTHQLSVSGSANVKNEERTNNIPNFGGMLMWKPILVFVPLPHSYAKFHKVNHGLCILKYHVRMNAVKLPPNFIQPASHEIINGTIITIVNTVLAFFISYLNKEQLYIVLWLSKA